MISQASPWTTSSQRHLAVLITEYRFKREIVFCANFEVEQVLLRRQAAAVADEGAVGADDAVAGHDDADRVAAVGQAHGAGGVGLADPGGELRRSDRSRRRGSRRSAAQTGRWNGVPARRAAGRTRQLAGEVRLAAGSAASANGVGVAARRRSLSGGRCRCRSM